MNYKKCYFASSSSMLGFQSYFDIIYNPNKLEKIYIIKGGPGTGKSSTIKAIGEHFDKAHSCEYFLCSSDPNSLDGLIIDGRVAVIDGTAPHNTDAKYPVAVEVILDNAKMIDEGITAYKQKIIELNAEKQSLYKSAFTYLRAIGEIKKQNLKALSDICDAKKLESAISRFFKQNLKKGVGYEEIIRLTDGWTSKGYVKTHSFEAQAKNCTIIINGKGYEEIIYKAFLNKAKEYGLKTHLSYDALIPYSPNGIYFSELGHCVVNYDAKAHGEVDYEKYKVINFERFVDKNEFNKLRSKMKFASKCSDILTSEATRYMKEASECHLKLEEIYTKHTCFESISENIEKSIAEISGHLSHN